MKPVRREPDDPQHPPTGGVGGSTSGAVKSAGENLSKLTIAVNQRPRRSRRSWLILMGAAAAVAAMALSGGWWYYQSTGRSVLAAMTTRPLDVDLLEMPRKASGDRQRILLVATGRIVSDVQIKIATKVSGQISELFIEQGDFVEKDQLLANIEDDIHRAQRDEAAAQAQRRKHGVTRSRSELLQARGRVAELQAQHEFEQRNHERLLGLHERGQIGDLEFFNGKNKYEMALASLEQARSAVSAAEAAIGVAEADLAAAEATLAMRQKRLDDCQIKSPMTGVVLERNAQVGDFLAAEGGRGANANAQLVEIADMTRLRVEVDVSERDVGRLTAGQAVRVTPDANREARYDGRVMWIDPRGDYARATVQVKVRILEPGPGLRVGGSGKVEFLSDQEPLQPELDQATVFWLPKAAVKIDANSGTAQVFTIIDDQAVVIEVEIGARTIRNVEVRSGVQSGMQLIAGGVADIEDGTAVRVRNITPLE